MSHPSGESGALSAEQYLDALRKELGKRHHRKLIEELRESCDEWTIGDGEADPGEPLLNRGRRQIDWPSLAWNGVVFDLSSQLQWTVEGDPSRWPLKRMIPEVAGYIALLYLELRAREAPAHDEERVIPNALIIAARHGSEPSLFRRYLLGWLDRAGSLEWNHSEFGPGIGARFTLWVNLAIALGSDSDPLIGDPVRACRQRLDQGKASGEARFRDFVRPDERELWREAIEASAPDAKTWAASFTNEV